MSNSAILSIGYRAALINGKWEIVPPKKETPIDPILNDIQRALKANLHFLALAMALALPDICACLESPTGHNIGRSTEAYKRWFDANLAHEFNDLTRLGQPDGISPSRMAEMLEVDEAGPKVRC